MSFDIGRANRFKALSIRLASDGALSPAVLDDVLQAIQHDQAGLDGENGGLSTFIECGAWTDAALDLLQRMHPAWQLSRLIYDGGEWHCTLSAHRDLPSWIGPTVESHHEMLPAAILKAMIEVANSGMAAQEAALLPSSDACASRSNLILCENFV